MKTLVRLHVVVDSEEIEKTVEKITNSIYEMKNVVDIVDFVGSEDILKQSENIEDLIT